MTMTESVWRLAERQLNSVTGRVTDTKDEVGHVRWAFQKIAD